MEEWRLAQDLVARRFPAASCAFLPESSMGAARTASSDLDVVVVIQGAGVHPRWEGVHGSALPAEFLVADREGWERYVAREIEDRTPVVLRITATGMPLRASPAETAVQASARRILEAGPPPMTAWQLDLRRRLLTDLLDDLHDAGDDIERAFVVEAAVGSCAELFLVLRRRWLGSGKWLGRLVAAESPATARALAGGARSALGGHTGKLLAVAAKILDDAGGAVRSDWVARAEIDHPDRTRPQV